MFDCNLSINYWEAFFISFITTAKDCLVTKNELIRVIVWLWNNQQLNKINAINSIAVCYSTEVANDERY